MNFYDYRINFDINFNFLCTSNITNNQKNISSCEDESLFTSQKNLIEISLPYSIFDDESNIKAAEEVTKRLLLAEELFQWNMECYQNTSLKDLIYIKFIEISKNVVKEELILEFISIFAESDLSKLSLNLKNKISKILKICDKKAHTELKFIENLCNTKEDLFDSTISIISNKKQSKKIDLNKITNHSFNVLKKAFYITEKLLINFVTRLENYKKTMTLLIRLKTEEVYQDKINYKDKHANKKLEKSVLEDEQEFVNLLKAIESFLITYKHHIKNIYKCIETLDNNSEEIHYVSHLNEFKNYLTSFQKSIFIKIASVMNCTAINLNSCENKLKEVKLVEDALGYEIDTSSLVNLTRNTSDLDRWTVVKGQATQSKNGYWETLKKSSLFIQTLIGFVNYTKRDYNQLSKHLPKENEGDIADLSWMNDDDLKNTKTLELIKVKTSPTKKNKAKKKEKILEKSLEEIPKKSIQKTETPEKELKNFLIETNQNFNVDIPFKSIHKFNALIVSSLESISFENISEEWKKKADLECQSHLLMLGHGIDLLAQTLLKNDIGSLTTIVPMIFLDMHTLFEQLMQMDYAAHNQTLFLDNHRLTKLLENTTIWQKVSHIKEIADTIDAASLWTRYVQYYKQRYEKSKRPEIVNHILFCLDLMTELEKGSLQLKKDTVTQLKELTEFTFKTITKTYECLFQYIHEAKGKGVSKNLKKHWIQFLTNSNTVIQKHLDQQVGVTVKEGVPSILKKPHQSLFSTLESIEKTKNKWSSLQSMEYGNPIEAMKEAEQQLKRFLKSITLAETHQKPILTAFHMRNAFGGAQWGIESLLKAICLLNDIPPLMTHNFSLQQQHIIINTSNENTQENMKNTEAESLNIGILFNYPCLIDKDNNKLFNKFKETLLVVPQYIDEKDKNVDYEKRNEFEETDLQEIITKAIDAIKQFADYAVEEISLAYQHKKIN